MFINPFHACFSFNPLKHDVRLFKNLVPIVQKNTATRLMLFSETTVDFETHTKYINTVYEQNGVR
jgi:hypothetical protein